MKKIIVLIIFLSTTTLFASNELGTCFIKGTRTVVNVTGYNCGGNYLEIWFYDDSLQNKDGTCTSCDHMLATCPSSVTITSTNVVVPFAGANLTAAGAAQAYKRGTDNAVKLCFYNNGNPKQSLACTLEDACAPK